MVNRFYMGHARGYREYQPELAVRCLLYAVDAVILRLGGGSDSISRDVIGSSSLDRSAYLSYIQVCLVAACVVTSNVVYLVMACLSWKQHATVNYARHRGVQQ